MTITFKDYPENLPNSIYCLDIVKESESLLLIIRETDYRDKENTAISYRLDKSQLKDFIGALLHVQSKLNK